MKAIITVHPYYGLSYGGWCTNIRDPSTDELWQKLFYYKTDAEVLARALHGKSLEEIFDIYGTSYFVRVL